MRRLPVTRPFIETPNMLIPFAQASDTAARAPSSPDLLTQFAPIAIIMVLFYFLLIRPQQKKLKEQRALLDALQKGDEVVTNGGMLGRVVKASPEYLTLEIADGMEIVVLRSAVANKLEKGTLRAAGAEIPASRSTGAVKLEKGTGRAER